MATVDEEVTLAQKIRQGGKETGKGKPKNMIPWDKLAEFFAQHLK